ncbi:hypothetical protein NDU88_010423 [Pleurodeles waltl]|uniref:Uncharacterized protein n=1 Tax=Pleurodeles waltl TaxID=8319 RepID=A0AAV7QUH1_PLEWA|nr:hypothetical protein NDU88_010423 [Pleurodeles waltl]
MLGPAHLEGLQHSNAPRGVRSSIYWAIHPPLTPRARSATHQIRQLILLPRWLDPVSWILLPRISGQHPGVPGRCGPGPPISGTQLEWTICPATISPVFAGVHQGPLSSVHSASLVCARAQSPASSQAASLFAPGSGRHLGISPLRYSLIHGLAPSPILSGASPVFYNIASLLPNRARLPLGHRAPIGLSATAGILRRRPPLSSGLRAASARSPARRRNLDLGPALVLSRGRPPPGAPPRRTPTGRDHTWAPRPPSGTSAAAGELARVPRRSEPSALMPLRIAAPCEAAASAARSGLRLPISPMGRFRHSPGSPQEPTHARSPPSASPHSLDLDRPGEGALPDLYSPAPPERDIQACAISGSFNETFSFGLSRQEQRSAESCRGGCSRRGGEVTVDAGEWSCCGAGYARQQLLF